MDRNSIIEKLYTSDSLNKTINNLCPVHLLDDFKQELFIELMSVESDYLIALYKEDKINFYCVRIILNMQSKKNKFHKKYSTNYDKAFEYLKAKCAEMLPDFDLSKLNPAIKYLKEKESGTAKDSHEYIIFNHYIELRSLDKVAAYFGIPKHHVWVVVSNIQNELKKIIKNG
jgi:hypothetical protein